jgi:GLPGLI family protein
VKNPPTSLISITFQKMANPPVFGNGNLHSICRMKRILLIATLFGSMLASAQSSFISEGKITYERRISQFNINKQDTDEVKFWEEEMKKVMSKVLVDQYTLEFTPMLSNYHLSKENTDNKYMYDNLKPNESNFVLQNFTTNSTLMIRNVFETAYSLSDSIKKFEWKITGEVREIAGFECKKAITKICDSVVVVAFYTDQITVKGGPENFNGLPGMILGLAIPRLASTWFATKVESTPVNIPKPTNKSKKVVLWADINKELAKGIKNWGKEAATYLWIANL